jgi:hypothetical protein
VGGASGMEGLSWLVCVVFFQSWYPACNATQRDSQLSDGDDERNGKGKTKGKAPAPLNEEVQDLQSRVL